jgi:hypothetical protein
VLADEPGVSVGVVPEPGSAVADPLLVGEFGCAGGEAFDELLEVEQPAHAAPVTMATPRIARRGVPSMGRVMATS